MATIEILQTDKVFVRTLFNNWCKVIVFVFVSDTNPASMQLQKNLENLIPLFGNFDNVKYFFVSEQQCPATFKKLEVVQSPTVIFTRTDKKILKKFEKDVDVSAVLDSLAIVSQEQRQWFQKERALWYPKIKKVLNEAQVIVFIKGTDTNPQCGFSSTFIDLLKSNKIEFSYYDIIADEYMRYWLRSYCGWPTYPQLHADGELIGGLDKSKELLAKNELLDRIPESSRTPDPAQRFSLLLRQHPSLVLLDGFSFESKMNEEFLEKATEKLKTEPSVVNASLDSRLKEHIIQKVGKDLPLMFVNGELQAHL